MKDLDDLNDGGFEAAFWAPTPRQRREADLFLADLLGEPAPRRPAPRKLAPPMLARVRQPAIPARSPAPIPARPPVWARAFDRILVGGGRRPAARPREDAVENVLEDDLASEAIPSDKVLQLDSKQGGSTTAIYVPAAALSAPSLSLLVWIHGNLTCGEPEGANAVSMMQSKTFPFAEQLSASKQPLVLVAPSMGWTGVEKHVLSNPSRMNAFLEEVRAWLAAKGLSSASSIGRLILAGHSRAYVIFNGLASQVSDASWSKGALATLTDMWQVDTTYGASMKQALCDSWMAFAKAKSGVQICIFYIGGNKSPTSVVAECIHDQARAANLRNVTVEDFDPGEGAHCALPRQEMPRLLSHSALSRRRQIFRDLSAGARENSAEMGLELDRLVETRPGLTQADAGFAPDADSPDHRHLLPEPLKTTAFSFTPGNLETLCRANRFVLPADATLVLFGLRACTLEGDALSSGWTASARLVEATPDHLNARCVMGVWDRTGQRIMVFKGSTVPFWRSMENFRQGGERCNMLSTGLYRYKIGTHRDGHPRLEIKGALLQEGEVVVLRTTDDLKYEVTDLWDSGSVGDNIHPARFPGLTPFSSEGCHTIPGEYAIASGAHSGSWADFRAAAGLTRASAPASENGRRFSMVLLTGREARCVGQLVNPAVGLARLRFGSQGPEVGALQQGLRALGYYRGGATNVMDVPTTLAYVRWQQATDGGRADAIVTVASLLDLGFDMIRGVAVAVPRPAFVLGDSVGSGTARNAPVDVAALKDRLIALGFDWVRRGNAIDAVTIAAIKLFQSIIAGKSPLEGDGRVDVPGQTYQWLQAVNAPRWQMMPAGSVAQGFDNVELRQTADDHDHGTSWLAEAIVAAGARYRTDFLATNPAAALLTVNDVSKPRGGPAPQHPGKTHECGLACDLRLPRLDGTAPGDTTWNGANKALYDRNAARGAIQALRAQRAHTIAHVFFNDTVLIGEGLCQRAGGHDDHIHFQISPPARGAIEMAPAVATSGAANRPGESTDDWPEDVG